MRLYNQSCYELADVGECSIDALVTDPPYGIGYQAQSWDKSLPDPIIWSNCLTAMKPGAYGAVFSSIRLMHRLMVSLEDSGFIIRDVLMWAFLNGMPKSRNLGLEIDKELGVQSEVCGTYNYVQGYRKNATDSSVDQSYSASKPKLAATSEKAKVYQGAGLGIKPAYEPIILVQKPMTSTVAENMIKYGTGALNIDATRLPYEDGEGKVGHNPHPSGRVSANVIRTDPFGDGYDKFFLVPKVRQHKETYNSHPTLKPVDLMIHLVKLVSWPSQVVLDPFMGSGTTGVACQELNRDFIGYEVYQEYFSIAERRIREKLNASIVC